MQFFNCNGLVIHYKWIDNKMEHTILFINSLGTDFRIWDDVVISLKDTSNILLFDKRGHGLSGTTVNRNGLNGYATDVLGLMKYLSIEKVTVVGLSVGGMIAQLLAYHHPEKIDKLILCDTRHKIGNSQIWNNRIAAVKTQGMKGISENIIERWFPEKFREEQYAMVTGCRNMLERVVPLGYIQICEAIRDADLTNIARQLKVPTLCLVGSEDKSTPPEYVKDLANLVKDAKYEVIEGSGHIPCMDNPALLSELIIKFINI